LTEALSSHPSLHESPRSAKAEIEEIISEEQLHVDELEKLNAMYS
jgi:hypothetical protein